MRLDASKKVTLPDLKVEAVRRWESQVKDYEKYHGPWNRQTIDPKVKDLINYRWMKDLFTQSSFRAERSSGVEPMNWQWLNHAYFPTEDLVNFLTNGTCHGKSTGTDMGHEEVNAWVRTQLIDFSFTHLQDTWEAFIVELPKRMDRLLNKQLLEVTHHTSMCNEMHKMIERSSLKTTNLVVPIYNSFKLALVPDTKKNIHHTIEMIDAGYDRAMKEVVQNNLFNQELFSRSSSGKDEGGKES